MVGINWHPILQGLEPEKVSFHSKNIQISLYGFLFRIAPQCLPVVSRDLRRA